MQGRVSLKLYILQVLSAGFPQCKSDVSASFIFETVDRPNFQIDSAYTDLFGISKFQQVLVPLVWKPSEICHTLGIRIAETC